MEGLSQQNIAEATGMAAPNIARLESCKRIPTMQVLAKYADAVGMEINIEVEVKRTYAYFKEPQNFAYRNFVEDTTLNRYEAEIQKSMGEDDLWLPW